MISRERPSVVAAAVLAVLTPVLCQAGSARVASVVDGDTLVVEHADGRRDTVRLIGVDTPETKHPYRPPEFFGDEATAFVKQRAFGKRVRLEADPETEDRDSYGRLLRYVYLPGGEMLNALLVRQGYGYALTRFPFSQKDRFVRLEARARDAELGVWSAGGLAEIRWIERHGVGSFAVYPTSNRHWAIAYGDHVKTHVPSNQLVRQLDALLALLAEHDGDELRQKLEAAGYLSNR